MRFVLFVCTGNYYRSRFAEILFNSAARERVLPWAAFSRGLDVVPGQNRGALSPHAIGRLHALGIGIDNPRAPQQLIEEPLRRADLAIALSGREHQPLVDARFPRWSRRFEYWMIDDVDVAPPEVALPALERNVLALVSRLEAQNRLRYPEALPQRY